MQRRNNARRQDHLPDVIERQAGSRSALYPAIDASERFRGARGAHHFS